MRDGSKKKLSQRQQYKEKYEKASSFVKETSAISHVDEDLLLKPTLLNFEKTDQLIQLLKD